MDELKLQRRILKPSYLTVDEVEHFLKNHAIVHGTQVGKDGKTRPQVVARYLINPDEPNVPHIHFYTDSKEIALRIQRLFKVAWQPWNPENGKARMSTYSFGKRETWFTEPALSDSFLTTLQRWRGEPSSRFVGPYWNPRPEPTNQVVWIQGRLEEPGEVSDIQLGVSEEFTFSDKVRTLKPLQRWADQVRAGEKPTIE
jgi:hypothetical protein